MSEWMSYIGDNPGKDVLLVLLFGSVSALVAIGRREAHRLDRCIKYAERLNDDRVRLATHSCAVPANKCDKRVRLPIGECGDCRSEL